jgi:hypothetical protein
MDNPESYDVYRYIHAKSSWMSAAESFEVAVRLAESGVKDGNVDEYMLQGVYKQYLEEKGDPGEGMSYFIASVPLAYMIANGIELALKGFRYAGHPSEAPTAIFKLPDLVEMFVAEFPEEEWMQALIKRYLTDEGLPELLAGFMKANGLPAGEFYNTRRYLSSTSFFKLAERYSDPYPVSADVARPFYQQVLEDAEDAMNRLADLQDDVDEDGNPGDAVKALKR